MMNEAEYQICKEKAALVKGETYAKIRMYQLNKIISLAKSSIDPLEIRGMLKLIADSDDWENQFIKKITK